MSTRVEPFCAFADITERECLQLARDWGMSFRRSADGSLCWEPLATGESPPELPPVKVFDEAEWPKYLHEEADKSSTFSTCYFIGSDHGPVKIGHSVNPQSRLRAIQMCSPLRLDILATRAGGEARESAYHCQFAEHRLHGEWFERAPEIVAEIERLNALPRSVREGGL